MKVLSLTEPYASLICEKKKRIETRSWRTTYRGELYIHASATKIPKESQENKELMALVDHSVQFGYILCKCTLVDCIYMTKDYAENIKKNDPQEYLCGDFKEGRYAWVLEDIQPLTVPIKAKGQLSIWNYYQDFEVMELMRDIEYGWMDQFCHKHFIVDEQYSDHYRLQSPQEVIKNKIGVCWDQVELERYYFKANDWNIKTYFLCYYDNEKCPTHTFLTYQKENQFYWFEHSWEKYRGIHSYHSIEELLNDVKEKFIATELQYHYHENQLLLREYQKPNSHLSAFEFYQHCEKDDPIHLEDTL